MKLLKIGMMIVVMLSPCCAKDLDDLLDGKKDHEHEYNCPDLPEPTPGVLIAVSGIMGLIFMLGYKLGQENQKHKI